MITPEAQKVRRRVKALARSRRNTETRKALKARKHYKNRANRRGRRIHRYGLASLERSGSK